MNGRVLFDFMYDQFVWPAHPFAGTMNEPEPKALDRVTTPVRASSVSTGHPGDKPSSGSLIVLADQRKKTT